MRWGVRTSRIKVPPAQGDSIYHCMTRTVNGERLFDDTAKEVLRKQLWQIADFCGVQVLTYAILSNHFHVLLRVPQAETVPDIELLRRYALLYPKQTAFQQARIEVIAQWLKTGDPEGMAWRKRQLALMGDVSQFMKLLKQRFSIWFNRTHNRYGTLWAERFKSVLVEPRDKVVETIAAYIDLNPVRARLITDPKDYRFCGYAEAVAGNTKARVGLRMVVAGPGHNPHWSPVQNAYRLTLFGVGSATREGVGSIPPSELKKVVAKQGRLSLPDVLRCRIRHFTDGAVLGSKAFVAEHLSAYQLRTGRRRKSPPKPLPEIADWGSDLNTLRGRRFSPADR